MIAFELLWQSIDNCPLALPPIATAAVTTATVVHVVRPSGGERKRETTLTDIPTTTSDVATPGHVAWLEFQKSL